MKSTINSLRETIYMPLRWLEEAAMFANQSPFLAALWFIAACADDSMTDASATCPEPDASNLEEAASLYSAAWDEQDPLARECLFRRGLRADVTLVDSAGELLGELDVSDRLGSAASSFSDQGLVRTEIDEAEFRHQEARLRWVVMDRAGTEVERGEDWLEFASDGTIARVHRLEGQGAALPTSPELLAWERAWNTRDPADRLGALQLASTDDVRFTDLIVDVQGRTSLSNEIARQLEAFDYRLSLDDTVRVFATVDGEPRLARQSARIVFNDGSDLGIVNYIRLRRGRIERLSGFPVQPL